MFLAITPNGKTVYVVSVPENGAPGMVTPISVATNTAGKGVQVGGTPAGIVVTPDGKTVYVLSNLANSLTPISTATNRAGQAIKVGAGPLSMVLGRGGKILDVADGNTPTVIPVNTATNTPGKAITVLTLKNYGNVTLAMTPDGKTLYAGGAITGPPFKFPGYVVLISTATGLAGKPISTGDTSPDAIGITPNGAVAYVACSGTAGIPGDVIPIDTATSKAGKAIARGAMPTAIVVAP